MLSDLIGQLVDLDPLDRLTRLKALTHRLKALALGLDNRVATHACLGGRDHGMRGAFNVGVAVATIHAHLPSMQAVTVRHRLDRGVAYVEVFGAGIKPDGSNQERSTDTCSDGSDERELVQ